MENNNHETSRLDRLGGQGFHTNPERINRAGRPKGSRNRKDIFKEWLEFVPEGSELPNVDLVVKAIIAKASTGDVAAAKEALDSGFGKVADEIHVESPKGTMSPASTRALDLLGKIGKKNADQA